MGLYDRLQKTANKLLSADPGKGQAVVITSVVPGVYNIATATAVNTENVQIGSGTIFDYGEYHKDGNEIKAGDRQLLLSPFNSSGSELTAPSIGDKITASGKSYRIEQIKEINPAGITVMYDIQLRGV